MQQNGGESAPGDAGDSDPTSHFGVPQFSGVPVFPGRGPSGYVSGVSEEFRSGDPERSIWHRSSATLNASHSSSDGPNTTTYLYTQLNATSEQTLTGEPTIDSFLALLHQRQRFLHTSWAYEFSSASYLPGSFEYIGFATPLDTAPVPEPATLALLTTGLVIAVFGRRRNWRRGPDRPEAASGHQ